MKIVDTQDPLLLRHVGFDTCFYLGAKLGDEILKFLRMARCDAVAARSRVVEVRFTKGNLGSRGRPCAAW